LAKVNHTTKDEKENMMSSDSDGMNTKFGKPIYDFDRIKERVTYHFCNPIIDKIDFVDHCSFAKMPGVWLASKKREEETSKSTNLKNKTIAYNYKEHIVKNCLRQLLRKEYEHAFGKCCYSMTNYNNILRVTIPYGKKFLIILNLQLKIMDEFNQLSQECYCKVIQTMEKLKELCNMKLQSFNNGEITSVEMLDDFFSKTPKHFPELRKLLRDVNFNKKIRYISIGTVNGIPLERLVITKERLLLDDFDEFEYFVETASGIKMRGNFSSFFGGTKFNLVVYEKIAVMTIPVPDTDFFVLVTLDANNGDGKDFDDEKKRDSFYFPDSMKKLFDFIDDKLDADSIIGDL